MNPIFITYIGFIVAALILIWAGFELLGRRRRTRKPDASERGRWVRLDTTASSSSPFPEPEIEDGPGHRARQNGHHTPTRQP